MPCEIIIFPGSSTSDKKEVAPEVRKEICEFAIEQAIREARRGGKRLLDALPSGVLDKMSSRGKFLYVVFESMGILQDALKKENKKYTELSDEIL